MREGLDWIARGIGNAITDIRQKVVEEPWFGRAVTPELTSHETRKDGHDHARYHDHSLSHEQAHDHAGHAQRHHR